MLSNAWRTTNTIKKLRMKYLIDPDSCLDRNPQRHFLKNKDTVCWLSADNHASLQYLYFQALVVSFKKPLNIKVIDFVVDIKTFEFHIF